MHDPGLACLLSNNEKQFIVKALQEDHRIDGRRPLDYRAIQIKISLDGTTATIMLGKTTVVTSIVATIESPPAGRPNEGIVQLFVDYSSMAGPGLDINHRAGEESTTEVQAMLDKAVKGIRAVDREALCIVAGRQAWKIRADIRVLDACGNVTDAVFLSMLTALMAFRRPDVTVEAGEDGKAPTLTVHPVEEREAVPLSLHQAPLATTFGLYQDGDLIVVDPSSKEEAASSATVTVVLNAHGEVCLLRKSGGLGLSISQTMYLVKVAGAKVSELLGKVKAALEVHESARVAARVRRQQPKLASGGGSRFAVARPAVDLQSGEQLRQLLGKELEALELAAAAVAESSDEEPQALESHEPVSDQSMLNEAVLQPDSEEGLPVGIGVRAPPGEALDASGGETLGGNDTMRETHAQQIGKVPAQEPSLENYQKMAAALSGSNAGPFSLEEAVVKKKRKKKVAVTS